MREVLAFSGTIVLILFALMFVATFIGIVDEICFKEGEHDHDDEFRSWKDSEAEEEKRA